MTCGQLLLLRERDGSTRLVAPIVQTAATWQNRLDRWLGAGLPGARGYLGAANTAVVIRWMPVPAGAASYYIHVIFGPAAEVTAELALRLPQWDVDIQRPRLGEVEASQLATIAPGELEQAARSARAVEQLVPLMAQILAGQSQIRMPRAASVRPEVVLWGLTEIFGALGDERPLSFVTSTAAQLPGRDGLLVSFQPGHPPAESPGSPYHEAAIAVVTNYADNGKAGLRHMLKGHPPITPSDPEAQVRRLFEVWPAAAPRISSKPTGVTVNQNVSATVCCTVCLSRFPWTEDKLWRWNTATRSYTELVIPAAAGPEQRNLLRRDAYVRCPNHGGEQDKAHYLPVAYGHYGPPTVLGFVGATNSGKSHLLATMVGAMDDGQLDSRYGVQSWWPVDQAIHQKYLTDRVRPLLDDNDVLPFTPTKVLDFVDAFIIKQAGGAERPVALFDIAGGDLADASEPKRFLQLVDGLIFVVDPAKLRDGRRDESFTTVLADVAQSDRADQLSAAIVINKADMLRFDDPIGRWLRSDRVDLDPELLLAESADTYAYLVSRNAGWTTGPYNACRKATLHIASPTGGAEHGGSFTRGVRPCRVLRPLAALLAMTGVLTGPEAEKVGI